MAGCEERELYYGEARQNREKNQNGRENTFYFLRDAGGSVRGGWGAAETDEFERRVAELVQHAGCVRHVDGFRRAAFRS
jgi:hypothetical protein